VERHGKALFPLTCERNLEGIVCKQRNGLNDTRRPHWVKVKNPNYSQAEGRAELIEELRNYLRRLPATFGGYLSLTL
jgi:ATP-dependent DNA ligase